MRDLGRAAEAYAALLRAPLFERAIHGGELPTRRAIALQAKRAASCLLVLLGLGLFVTPDLRLISFPAPRMSHLVRQQRENRKGNLSVQRSPSL